MAESMRPERKGYRSAEMYAFLEKIAHREERA